MKSYYMRDHKCAICNNFVLLCLEDMTVTCECGVLPVPMYILNNPSNKRSFMKRFRSIKAEAALYWLNLYEKLAESFE